MSEDIKVIKKDEGKIVEQSGEEIREIYEDEEKDLSFAEADITKSDKHYHKETTEYYYVMNGDGILNVNGELIHLEEGDFVKIPPSNIHIAEGNLKILVISIPIWDKNDVFEVNSKSENEV